MMPTTLLMTTIAMLAFAANSLLGRAALAGGAIDAASFTVIRVLAGAVALALLFAAQHKAAGLRRMGGNWPSALALLAYAVAFSFAYQRLGAAIGALILFAAVQGSMIILGIMRRDLPTPRELAGLVVAFGAFVYLLLPGLHAPEPLGSLLMVISGSAWGYYSVRGRGAGDPTSETTGNFLRAALAGLVLIPFAAHAGHVDAHGAALAVISGAITSGLGYIVWYRAMPGLSTTQAATVQLTVPIIAALGAVLFLAETLTLRLVIASFCLLGGVAFSILARRPAGAPATPPRPGSQPPQPDRN